MEANESDVTTEPTQDITDPLPQADPATIVAIGSRWRNRRTGRFAEVTGAGCTGEQGMWKVGYRYEKAIDYERRVRQRNQPHTQTCWVTKERFLAAFSPARSRKVARS